MGILDFTSYYSFYRSLKAWKESLRQAAGIGSHHCYGGTKQIENKYGTTRAKMSMVMNEGVKIHCRSITTQVFTVVGLLVEIDKSIEKSKGRPEASLSTRYPSVTVTSTSPVIYSSFFSSFLFSSALQSHL